MIEAVAGQAKALFALSAETRAALHMKRSPASRGYSPLAGQVLDPGKPADLKESFYLGPELPLDHPFVQAGLFNCGPNQWPELPGFRVVTEGYLGAMIALAEALMGGITLALGLRPGPLHRFCRDPPARCACCTIRRSRSIPCRSRWAPALIPISAPSPSCGRTTMAAFRSRATTAGSMCHRLPGTFVVNLGDMMARWTNDRFRSTRHRVINPRRRSLFHPVLLQRPSRASDRADPRGEPALYPPTTVEGHLREMYRRSYGAA